MSALWDVFPRIVKAQEKPAKRNGSMLKRAFEQTEKSFLNVPVRKSDEGKVIHFPSFAVKMKSILAEEIKDGAK